MSLSRATRREAHASVSMMEYSVRPGFHSGCDCDSGSIFGGFVKATWPVREDVEAVRDTVCGVPATVVVIDGAGRIVCVGLVRLRSGWNPLSDILLCLGVLARRCSGGEEIGGWLAVTR
jgi:hypothetical protein